MFPPLRLLERADAPAGRRPSLELAFTAAGVEVALDARPPEASVVIEPAAWTRAEGELFELDDRVFAAATSRDVALVDDGSAPARLAEVALQVAVRYQRFDRSRNAAASAPLFERVLTAHECLFDRARPLVAADHAHALDTWRWLLRLEPDAGLAAQLGALFHDVERLLSEADSRVEHRAAEYAAFKRAHAEAGARLTSRVLEALDAPRALVNRAASLVARHEEPGADDPEAAALASADALSFFSLNAPGFAKHYGLEHTARKVAYSARRLDAAGRAWLPRLKLTTPIRTLLEPCLRSAP